MPRNSPVPPISLFRVLARHLPLSGAMEPLGKFHLGRGPDAATLPPRVRELVILRVCARLGCEYEWGVHVGFFAGRVGLTDAQVAETVHGPAEASPLSAAERRIIALVDSLHDHGAVDDAAWAELARDFTEAQLLELLVLAGWYHAVAFVANGARVPLEAWAPRFPEAPAA